MTYRVSTDRRSENLLGGVLMHVLRNMWYLLLPLARIGALYELVQRRYTGNGAMTILGLRAA